ncbi:MAG: glycosyltransferase family 39 protein [Anaerolineales bacterium]|nr:glycosyltransferase family 39 protein [Anaerolineales bacterium]
MFSVRNLIWTTIAALLIAHVVLLSAAPLELRTVAALCIAAYIPGFLLIRWLDLPPFRARLPALTATVAAGIAVQTWLTLFALYAPGALSRTRLLVVFDLFTVTLLLLILWSHRRKPKAPIAGPVEQLDQPRTATHANSSARIVVIAGALLLLTIAVYFRFADLGAAQFQGDEATAIVYAAAVAQGHEEVIFQHRRGPVDILIPASTMVLTGAANEAALRLPFAVAALAGVAAIFLLGGLLFGGLAGWLAALLAAFDGYLVGFGRVMHYESVVVLTAALGVYVLYQLLQDQKAAAATTPGKIRRALLLTALLLATGMAAHYDGAAALIPAGYLLWRLWRTGLRGRAFVHVLWLPVAGAAVLLLSFYTPYLVNPYFRETLEFYTGTLAGAPTDARTVNHVAMLAESLLLYNGGLKTVLMIGAPACGLILLFWQQPRRRFRLLAIFAAFVFLTLLLTAYIPLTGLADWIPFFCAVLVVGAVAAPRQTDAERVLWLWLLLPFFVAMFVVQQPGLHFYFFVTPWLLLTGWLLDRLYRWVQVRSGQPLAAGAGIALLIASAVVFGVHAYRFSSTRPNLPRITSATSHRPPGGRPIGMAIHSCSMAFPTGKAGRRSARSMLQARSPVATTPILTGGRWTGIRAAPNIAATTRTRS